MKLIPNLAKSRVCNECFWALITYRWSLSRTMITAPSGPYRWSLSRTMITAPSGAYSSLSRTMIIAPSGPYSSPIHF